MQSDRDRISIEEVQSKVEKAHAAWRTYRTFSQEKIDAIVERMAEAGRANAQRLAELAVEETGYGNAKDKLAKNLLCADVLPRKMRGLKTVGVLREIPEERLVEIGVPVGVVAAILPTTNPTSTAIFKSLISLKAGNAVVLSPHPHAVKCTCETANVLYRAAREAGAPEDIIGCITTPTLEATNALMRHERTGIILSTGGHGIVRAAYSSGKPALGVGPGNVPVMLERSADVAEAVAKVVEGKSFDYGTVCSSEQAIVAEEPLRARILSELKTCKAFFCNASQKEALSRLLVTPQFTINPKCVGQPAPKIARMAGFEVPQDTPILVVDLDGVGKEHPLSAEKLSPVLALYFVPDFAAGLKICESLLRFGGLGHTCVIHSKDDARIREYALAMPAFRVLVNTPAPQGSTGITTNIWPSMTLGCGAIAGNVTSDNIGPLHLINIKRLAYVVRKPEEAFESAQPPQRDKLATAVETYLSARGIRTGIPAATNATSATSQVVDRFLASRQKSTPSVAPSCPVPSTPVSACGGPAAVPAVKVVDFVCEEDVRQAMKESRKIYIGPRTIVTPLARDLGERSDILVVAERQK